MIKSMVEFVLIENEVLRLAVAGFKEERLSPYVHFADSISNHAKFLSRKLDKGMFVACGEDGKVLEKPYRFEDGYPSREVIEKSKWDWAAYSEALDRVLFKGFYVEKHKGMTLSYTGIRNSEEDSWVMFQDKETGEWYPASGRETVEDLVGLKIEMR